MSEKALLIVDVQNDFCPGGTLGVPYGDQVITPINRVASYAKDNRWLIMASRDWHPRQTVHFTKWPKHCVQNTFGAEFHPLLSLPPDTLIISKGMNDKDDGYSLFEGMRLRENEWPLSPEILLRGTRELFIGGLATDYCVKQTALDGIKMGFKTHLFLDACRAVNVNPDDDEKAIAEMLQAGVIVTGTKNMINE